jgi:hypothetical protein
MAATRRVTACLEVYGCEWEESDHTNCGEHPQKHSLWDVLKNEGGYEEFFLGEINQDPLENAFGVFKFYASQNKTPTSFELVNGNTHY